MITSAKCIKNLISRVTNRIKKMNLDKYEVKIFNNLLKDILIESNMKQVNIFL